jgi:photosystem II stability/assembly factor-like uncharacterized protein
MDAVDPMVVWAIGYDGTAPSRTSNMFTRTTNAGTNWTSGVVWPDTNTWIPSAIEGIDANTAFVACYAKATQANGAVFKTTNGGVTWQNMNTGSMFTNPASFVNLTAFTSPSLGIVMGDPIGGEFEIYRTADGGGSWTQVPGTAIPNPLSGEYGLTNIYTKVANNIWFGTNKNRIYHSTDDGATWSVSPQFTSTIGAVLGVQDVAFRDVNNGLALVYFGPSGAGTPTLWRTNNGGATWTNVGTISPNYGYNDMCAIPGTTVYASVGAGTGNTIMSYSTDDGTTWTDWGSIGIQYLTVDFVDYKNGWAGAFSDPSVASVDGMWKYVDSAFAGPTAPVAQFQMPPVVCFSAAVTVTNTSTGNPVNTYSWSASSPAVNFFPGTTSTSPTLGITAPGTYTITLVATNSVGVNSTQQVINVISCAAPTAVFTMTNSTCTGTAAPTSNSSSGSPTPAYMWSASPSTSVNFNPTSATAQPTINFGVAGTYTITLTATNINGTTTATQVVTVNPVPIITVVSSNSVLCSGNTATLTASGASTYSWTSPAAVAGNTNFTVAVSPTVNTNYNVTGYTAAGCKNNKIFNQPVSPCTGIESITAVTEDVRIYPNPNSGNCTIKAGSDITLNVVNELGQMVKTIVLSSENNHEATLENLPGGIYFVYGSNHAVVVKQKIVVAK